MILFINSWVIPHEDTLINISRHNIEVNKIKYVDFVLMILNLGFIIRIQVK